MSAQNVLHLCRTTLQIVCKNCMQKLTSCTVCTCAHTCTVLHYCNFLLFPQALAETDGVDWKELWYESWHFYIREPIFNGSSQLCWYHIWYSGISQQGAQYWEGTQWGHLHMANCGVHCTQVSHEYGVLVWECRNESTRIWEWEYESVGIRVCEYFIPLYLVSSF